MLSQQEISFQNNKSSRKSSRRESSISVSSLSTSKTVIPSKDQLVPVHRKKVVVIGDGAIGKTCMLGYYTTKSFPEGYVPTVFESMVVTTKIDDEPVEISFDC